MIARTFAWIFALGLTILTIVPASARPETGVQHDLEHFVAFVIAGFLFAYSHKMRISGLLTCAVVFTLVLELLQIPIPTRHARLEDFIVNAAAVSIGIAAAVMMSRWRSQKQMG
jgi:VanZ family protein